MLILNDVVKTFGANRAVDGITVQIQRGTITGLIGPNGAGKTTLFNVLAGAMSLTSGTVTLDGRAIGGLRADQIFNAGLGRTFQIPKPFSEMTVLDNVMLAVRTQAGENFWANWISPSRVAVQEREVRDKALHWLDFVGLAKLANDAAKVLSGGQRKRVNIASFLVKKGDVIEVAPTSKEVNKILSAIQAVARRTIPSWLDANHAAFKGTIKDLPMRDEVTIPVEESMIVEYYSR